MRGPYSTPITPLTGSLFHADPQIYSAGLGRDPRYQLSELMAYMGSKMATNTREAKTIRREHKAVEGQRYTMRRAKRLGRGKA